MKQPFREDESRRSRQDQPPSPSEFFFAAQRNFFAFPDTSAAALREYLGEGARDPNLDTKNGTTALFKTINMKMPIPDEVPGDLKLARDINRIESLSSRVAESL